MKSEQQPWTSSLENKLVNWRKKNVFWVLNTSNISSWGSTLRVKYMRSVKKWNIFGYLSPSRNASCVLEQDGGWATQQINVRLIQCIPHVWQRHAASGLRANEAWGPLWVTRPVRFCQHRCKKRTLWGENTTLALMWAQPLETSCQQTAVTAHGVMMAH